MFTPFGFKNKLVIRKNIFKNYGKWEMKINDFFDKTCFYFVFDVLTVHFTFKISSELPQQFIKHKNQI